RFEDTDMWRRLSKITYIHAMAVETCRLRTHMSNSLETQNPEGIRSALAYYANKIMVEDTDIPLIVRRRGIGRLYYYYAEAFLSVAWRDHGRASFRLAYEYWPFLFVQYVCSRVLRGVLTRTKYCYYHSLNRLYSLYSAIRNLSQRL